MATYALRIASPAPFKRIGVLDCTRGHEFANAGLRIVKMTNQVVQLTGLKVVKVYETEMMHAQHRHRYAACCQALSMLMNATPTATYLC